MDTCIMRMLTGLAVSASVPVLGSAMTKMLTQECMLMEVTIIHPDLADLHQCCMRGCKAPTAAALYTISMRMELMRSSQ